MENRLAKNRRRGILGRNRSQDPFHELQREMNRLFNGWLEPSAAFGEMPTDFMPTIDVTDGDKEVCIRAELPGIDEKDINVAINDNELTIQGEKKEEQEEKGHGFYHKESSHGSFRRIIDLPAEVDEDKAEAEFRKGVLKITLPKSAESQKKAKKIKVKTG